MLSTEVLNSITTISSVSIIGAAMCIMIGGISPALGEAKVATTAIQGMTQQPDEAGRLSSTMFVAMAMVESTAIYSLVVSMILLFANPFLATILESVK